MIYTCFLCQVDIWTEYKEIGLARPYLLRNSRRKSPKKKHVCLDLLPFKEFFISFFFVIKKENKFLMFYGIYYKFLIPNFQSLTT